MDKKKIIQYLIMTILAIILIIVIAYLVFKNQKLVKENEKFEQEQKDKYSHLEQEYSKYKDESEQKYTELNAKYEKLTNRKSSSINNLISYYENKMQQKGNLKVKANIKDNTLFDDLNLHVGDIYNVMGKDNRIVVFCSVISGEYPEVGDVFYIETDDSQYVYEAVIAKIEESSNSDGSELLFVYFDGVKEEDIKFTPQIRRLK